MRAPRCLAVAFVLALAACSGSGNTIAPPTMPTAPNRVQQAKLTLSFPVGASRQSSERRPAYIPPTAATLTVTINSINGSATLPSWVPAKTTLTITTSGSNPPCSISGTLETCTFSVPAPPGAVSYTFTVDDAAGAALSTVTQVLTIAAGSANANLPTVTLDGIVNIVVLALPKLNANTPLTAAPATSANTVRFSAMDASGNVINADPFSAPLTLADTDAGGATQLSLNGGTAASSITVTSPTDVVTVVYSGLALTNATAPAITVTSGGKPIVTALFPTSLQPIAITGTTIDANASDPSYNAPTLFLIGTGSTYDQTFTAAELGYTNAPYDKTLTIAPSLGCSSIATAAIAGNSATVTGVGAGFCQFTVSDANGQSQAVWAAVSTTSIGVN